jgi:hypothetical protein
VAANLLLEGTDLEALLVRAHQEGGAAARIVRAEKVRRGGFLGFFAREGFEVAVEIPNDSRGQDDVADSAGGDNPEGAGAAFRPPPPDPATSLLGLAERASVAERAAAKAVAAQAAYEAATRTVPEAPAAPAPLQVEAITGHVVEEPGPPAAGGPGPVVAEEFVTEKFTGQAYVYDDDDPDAGHEIEYQAEHVEFTRIEFPAVVDVETAAELGEEIAAELGSGWTIETSVETPDEVSFAALEGTQYPGEEFAEVHYGEVEYGDPPPGPDLADVVDLADLRDFAVRENDTEHTFAGLPSAPEPVPYHGSAAWSAAEHYSEDEPSAEPPAGEPELRPQFTSLVDQLRASVRLGRHRADGARHTPDHPAVAALNPFAVGPPAGDDDQMPGEPTPAQVDAWNQVVHEGTARATTVVPRTRSRRGDLPSPRAAGDDQDPRAPEETEPAYAPDPVADRYEYPGELGELDEPAPPRSPHAGPPSRSSLRSSTENAWRLLRQWRPGTRRGDLDAGRRAELEAEAGQWTAEDLEEELTPSFSEAATSGEVPAEAAVIRSFDQLSEDREALRQLGVPAAWTRHLHEGDRFTSVVDMLGRLPQVAIDPDTDVIAVVGTPDVVELEAHRTALDLPADGRPRAVVRVPGQTGVDRRSALARSRRTRPVVVAVPVDSYDDPAEIRKVLAGVRAGAVIAVIDASRSLEDITRAVEALDQVDALALDGALGTGRPAAVLGLDVPVIRVDGISVDRIGWAALLCAQLTGNDAERDDADWDDDPDPVS